MSHHNLNVNRSLNKPISTIISDRFLFCLIVIMGGVGCYYSFGLIQSSQQYSTHEILLRSKDYTENDLLKYAINRPLTINGDMKVGHELQIFVDQMLQTDPLYVDFGNGEIEKVVGTRKLNFVYGLPGLYGVELFTVEDNQKITLSSQEVNIDSDYSQYTLSGQ